MADLLTKVARTEWELRSGVVRPAAGDFDGVAITPSVIDPDDLARRMAAARTNMAAAARDVVTSEPPTLGARAERLHRLWSSVSPRPLERGAGVRGRATFELKRTVRRLTSWYVEPRWAGQHEVDAETARFASDVAAQIAELQAQVEYLQTWNDRLQREVRASRRDNSGGR
jgi:hypothetical protein